MGVMECNREGCGKIMCDLYSDNFGYICHECFREMKGSGMKIGAFMNTMKGSQSTDYDDEFQ